MPSYEELIDDRYKIRFYFSKGSKSPLSSGYSLKFTLMDEKNLLLYQNILELTYSRVNRAVKQPSRGPSRGDKGRVSRNAWDEKTLQLLSKNFVEDGSRILGEEYRSQVKKAMKKLRVHVDALLRSPPDS